MLKRKSFITMSAILLLIVLNSYGAIVISTAKKTKPPKVEVPKENMQKLEEIKAKATDAVAWLQIPNTDIKEKIYIILKKENW